MAICLRHKTQFGRQHGKEVKSAFSRKPPPTTTSQTPLVHSYSSGDLSEVWHHLNSLYLELKALGQCGCEHWKGFSPV